MTPPMAEGMVAVPLSKFERDKGVRYHFIRKGTNPPGLGRRCKDCGVLLVSYNKKDICSFHTKW